MPPKGDTKMIHTMDESTNKLERWDWELFFNTVHQLNHNLIKPHGE